MSIFDPSAGPWAERARSLVRIVTGLVFISYGTMKLFNYPPSGMPGFPVSIATQIGLAAILETFGGLLIALGLFTRPVAFILSGEMAVAYFQGHASKSFWPPINQGTPAIMYCFWFLYLVFAGPGPWSIDALIARAVRQGITP
jgi:putative oxidoreductase